MPQRTISQTFKLGGVLTNATSAKLSDPTSTFGVKRNDTDAVVVADGTNMLNPSTGVYQYTFTAVANIAYTAYIEFVYDGDTIFVEFDIPAVSDDFGMVASYDTLLERVGHELFGIRSDFTADQTTDILQCIRDGLRYVYSAHEWSFFRPVQDITTTAPYTTGTITVASGVVTLTGGTWPTWADTGILKVNSNYYHVASRDTDTQVTLDYLSLTIAVAATFELGRPEIPMPDEFEAVSGDRSLTYYPGLNECYPPVCEKHDQALRTMQQNNPDYERPRYYSIRTTTFDPAVGSRKRLAFYPTPDASYVLRVPMILRPLMITTANPYPVGSEQLSQLIIEACLSSVELDFYEKTDGRHTQVFRAMLAKAIATDQERSSPTSLGPDMPKGERGRGIYDDYWLRSSRIGTLTLDGDTL